MLNNLLGLAQLILEHAQLPRLALKHAAFGHTMGCMGKMHAGGRQRHVLASSASAKDSIFSSARLPGKN